MKNLSLPIIYNGGTPAADLLDKLNDATRALREAREKLAACCPNARDYNGDFTDARNDHLERLRAVNEVIDELDTIQIHICDKC